MRVSKLWHSKCPIWENNHFKFWEQEDKNENLVKVEGQGQNFSTAVRVEIFFVIYQ